MTDTETICDDKFSLDILADLVGINHAYVSQTINECLNKNFRTLLNEYRIREAQRLFSTPEAKKYTIEFIVRKVGFKSKTTFISAFKDVTGVSPYYYFKSLKTGGEGSEVRGEG